MTFPDNFFTAAFAGAFLTTLFGLPLWRKWCLRTNLVDDPGHRKIHDSPIPLAGGFAVLTGILLPLLAGTILLKLGVLRISSTALIVHGINRRALELAVLGLGAVAITLLGWLDDKHELKPLAKFIGQLLVAIAVAAACKRITLFVHSEFFSYAVTVLWLLTVMNAFNFIDNMNGLCAGLGTIGAFLFALIAARDGEYLVALDGISHGRRTARLFALQLSESARVSWRCRQPSGRLSPRRNGDSAALLHQTESAPAGRVVAVVRIGRSVARPRASQPVSHVEQETILDRRYQPPFPSTRAGGFQPHQGGMASVACRHRRRFDRLHSLLVSFVPKCAPIRLQDGGWVARRARWRRRLNKFKKDFGLTADAVFHTRLRPLLLARGRCSISLIA